LTGTGRVLALHRGDVAPPLVPLHVHDTVVPGVGKVVTEGVPDVHWATGYAVVVWGYVCPFTAELHTPATGGGFATILVWHAEDVIVLLIVHFGVKVRDPDGWLLIYVQVPLLPLITPVVPLPQSIV
jgi:hypothetical protein